MSTTQIFVSLITITIFKSCSGRVDLKDFYPYGLEHGDAALPRNDDSFSSIDINFKFPFFGTAYTQVQISTNGVISFGSGTNDYEPVKFPLENFRSIAVYWSDSDPGEGGDIFYRETNNSDILKRISNDITSRFVGYRSFQSTWALISTYSNVAQFGCGPDSSSNCPTSCNNTLTYQSILTSDGVNSFTIFLFNKLDFTSGTAACEAHAQIGFNAGDGKRFFLVPSSNTEAISTTALSTSNVGVPGLWMFSIDGSDIQSGCNDHGRLDVSLRKVVYFAREDIRISGPCFNEVTGNVTVTFGGDIEVSCRIISGLQLQCVTPLLSRMGWLDVTLTYRSILYTTYISVIDINDELIVHSDWVMTSDTALTADVQVTWDASLFGGASMVEIRGAQIDSELTDGNGATAGTNPSGLRDLTIPVRYSEVPNTGNFIITPAPFGSIGTNYIQRFMLIIYASNNSTYNRIARIIMRSITPTCALHCNNWYANQPSATALADITNRAARRNPCPPSVNTAFPRQLGGFEIDSSCNPDNPNMCNLFHPGSKGCYKSTNNIGVEVVVQCCYDSNGGLLLGSPAGGTVDFADSKKSVWQHFHLDVIPYFTCCRCSNDTSNDTIILQCTKYCEKRPSVDSRWFRPPGWGNGGGDPHFATIDGSEFTFNPIGEFTYLQANNDIIQVRISQFIDANNLRRPASYFSAFAIRGNASSTVQLELNGLDKFAFRVNGESILLQYGTWNFNEISLNYVNASMATVHLTSGLEAEFHIDGGVLNVILSVPETARGRVSGLIGNWDDVPGNDLQLPNGTWIPLNSSHQDIHNIFGMSWVTTKSTSLFAYATGLTWEDFQDPDFTPDYSTPNENAQCDGNAQCNYDAHVTGSVEIGLANIARQARAAQLKSMYDQLSGYCPSNVNIANGLVTVSRHNDSSVSYSVRCNDGYRIDGNAHITCMNGRYDSLPLCAPVSTSAATSITHISASLILLITLFVV